MEIGILAVSVMSLPAGSQMKAFVAMFLTLRDGKIISQRNYDCYPPPQRKPNQFHADSQDANSTPSRGLSGMNLLIDLLSNNLPPWKHSNGDCLSVLNVMEYRNSAIGEIECCHSLLAAPANTYSDLHGRVVNAYAISFTSNHLT